MQNGAAIACSRLTTVMPRKGRDFPAEGEEEEEEGLLPKERLLLVDNNVLGSFVSFHG